MVLPRRVTLHHPAGVISGWPDQRQLAGAAGGALSDYGIDDKFMKELGAELEEGHAAVLFLIRKVSVDKVIPKIQIPGKVIQTRSTTRPRSG